MLNERFVFADSEGARKGAIIEIGGLILTTLALIGDGAVLEGVILSEIAGDVVIDILEIHRYVRALVGDRPAEHGEALEACQGNGSVIHGLHHLQCFGYGQRGFQHHRGRCAPQ